MTRVETVETVLCDPCLERGLRTEAHGWVDGVNLCPDHERAHDRRPYPRHVVGVHAQGRYLCLSCVIASGQSWPTHRTPGAVNAGEPHSGDACQSCGNVACPEVAP